jgi:predicted  nucleic acid-binding Zn-ribbon protein
MGALEELAQSERYAFVRLLLRVAGLRLQVKALQSELAEVKGRLAKLETSDVEV